MAPQTSWHRHEREIITVSPAAPLCECSLAVFSAGCFRHPAGKAEARAGPGQGRRQELRRGGEAACQECGSLQWVRYLNIHVCWIESWDGIMPCCRPRSLLFQDDEVSLLGTGFDVCKYYCINAKHFRELFAQAAAADATQNTANSSDGNSIQSLDAQAHSRNHPGDTD